jgi:hypothetical protein
MRNTTKIIVAVVALLTIGASAGFANYWTSSQTGSVTVLGTTYYPWDDWTCPYEDWQEPGIITGSWDTGVAGLDGWYYGVEDEIYTGPGNKYTGNWGAQGEAIHVIAGTFILYEVVRGLGSPYTDYDGTWLVTFPSTTPTSHGTMSGTLYRTPYE